MTNPREQAIAYTVLGAFSLFALLPIVGIVFTALQDPNGAATFGSFDGVHLGNFADAWREGHFGTYLKSSAIVTVAVVAVASVLSILAGYAFGLMRFRGSEVLFYVMLLGLMIPTEAMIVPLYYDFRDLGLVDTYWALILPQIGTSIAFGTFWMRAFFRSAPRPIIESARVDGAGHFRTLVAILVPQATPAILTLSVLLFMYTWNEFLLALVMNPRGTLLTAPLALTFFAGSQRTTDQTVVAAAAVLVALPVVVAYALLQRQFIRGFLSGAVKGE
jgi:raffinose/stachyose/melibiose transport system permease protein